MYSLIFSLIVIVLVNTRYYWEQFGGFVFPIIGTLIFVLLIIIIAKIIFRFRLLIRFKKLRTLKSLIPIIIYLFAVIESILNPFNFSSENFQSKIKFRACYEGTMNTAIIKFRENNRFDFSWGGFMGYANYYKGTWELKSDTLIMNYKNEKPKRLNDTLFINKDYFYQIKSDSLIDTRFYLGYCKGLN